MAWTAPRTWVAGETVTAALMNTHVRDNLLETMVAKTTAAGDLVYASAANSLLRLPLGSARTVLRVSTGSTGPAYGPGAPISTEIMGASLPNYRIETGVTTSSSSGPAFEDFAIAFTGTPTVQLTVLDNANYQPTVEAVTATGFTLSVWDVTPARRSVSPIHWLAVGADT